MENNLKIMTIIITKIKKEKNITENKLIQKIIIT